MKIRNTMEAWFKKATETAVPVVKKEFEKVVKRSTVNVKDTAFMILGTAAFLYGCTDIRRAKEIVTGTSEIPELLRTVNITYNEVHNTYHYYAKECACSCGK